MHQPSGGNDGDDARPQRQLVIDEDDIGAASFGDNAAISKSCRPRRRRRNQIPGFSQRQHTVGGEAKSGEQLRRIVIV
jgi:hypothetical protein